jgi:hypothetical protein
MEYAGQVHEVVGAALLLLEVHTTAEWTVDRLSLSGIEIG